MATFVLVHGSWAGSVVWRQLAPRLRKAGHEVYAPTLTGIGERKHLLSRDIDLDTHTQDVIGVIDDEDLSDIVLVGHSYAGMVISGVADRVPEKVASLVYLDAFVPEKRTVLVQHIAARPASCHRAGRGLAGSANTPGGVRPQTSRSDLTLGGKERAASARHLNPGDPADGRH